MQDGRVPEQKIKLRHGDTLLIDTMEGNTMMNWLKRFLAGGFQVHCAHSKACTACSHSVRVLMPRFARCAAHLPALGSKRSPPNTLHDCDLSLSVLTDWILFLLLVLCVQVHLQGNPFLHAVFGFTPLDSRPERLTAQEKRFFRSPSSAASKARSQTRRSERAFKDHGGGGW